jgi:hypothetical protein
MELTGVDYVYLTNIDPAEVEARFVAGIKDMWPAPVIDDTGLDGLGRTKDQLGLFFQKDEAMGRFQEENGYALNENGEGCFMLSAVRDGIFDSHARIEKILHPVHQGGVDPYEVRLFFRNAWFYTLVLPAPIDESPFSKRIHDLLMDSLSASMGPTPL